VFAWLISLLLLFGYHGSATTVPSARPGGNGNRHVAPADNQQPNSAEPADSDGTGSGGGGHN
jgi:hypothetical protein